MSKTSVPAIAHRLARDVATITSHSPNEESLKHEIENRLEAACGDLNIPWTPYQLNRSLLQPQTKERRFADAAHGAVVIEYEPPRSFNGKNGAVLRHAQAQAEEYAALLSLEEGRAIDQYVLVAWDGDHISFGVIREKARWEAIRGFDEQAARRLLQHMEQDGAPLVSPRLLSAYFGPEEEKHGGQLVPLFFHCVVAANRRKSSKTYLLFKEWSRLFGQAAGAQSDRLKEFLVRQGQLHVAEYSKHPSEYLFALNTYIALVAKLVAAYSLPGASEDLRDASVAIGDRVQQLETGELFRSAGISNLLVGDFFSWHRDDAAWPKLEPVVGNLMEDLGAVDFDPARRSPQAVRDLFKQMYQAFVPREMRHALGEYYTPDWLAGFVLDTLKWTADEDLLDPTCGSGTFLLEAVKRRRASPKFKDSDVGEVLSGIHGMDLNPLAVLTARASIVTFIGDLLDPANPVQIPVYLADSINSAEAKGGIFEHNLQTDRGVFSFQFPEALVRDPEFYEIMETASRGVNASLNRTQLFKQLSRFQVIKNLGSQQLTLVQNTVDAIIELHRQNWDGIWCMILAERFTAGAIERVKVIAGNPPWVKWSHLPREYADFIKPLCERLGVFSEDAWVGGIESDISTVVTYEAIRKWLAVGGHLGFLITGTVFKNESSQGFRRFALPSDALECSVLGVHDFQEIRPFEDTTNHPVLFVVKRDATLRYPVPYFDWHMPVDKKIVRTFPNAEAFRSYARREDLLAEPVPGSDAGPWLIGSADDHEIWKHVFNQKQQAYQARKGVTTDFNGVFFVRVVQANQANNRATIENNPDLGRGENKGIPRIKRVIETDHLFPLLRGKDVAAFAAEPEPEQAILVPQRGMHGDPALPVTHKLTYDYLMRFSARLPERSSYKRFQRTQPMWSVWSTGAYTFSPFKVVWKEMSGGRFVAAYVGSASVRKDMKPAVVVPDHKVYFIPVDSEAEAAFLTGLLNAPLVRHAVSAYAAQLSLGVSVAEYLAIPKYDAANREHRSLSDLARSLNNRGSAPTDGEWAKLDKLARSVLMIPTRRAS